MYEVEYANSATFTGATYSNNQVTGATQLSIITDPGRTYYWRVRAWNTSDTTGVHSAWSLVRTIKVKFVAATLTSPIGGATGATTRPTFEWDDGGATNANGAWTSYTIQVANNAAFTAGLRTFTVPASATTYTIPNSLPELSAGLKYWRVKVNGLYAPIFSTEVFPANTFTP